MIFEQLALHNFGVFRDEHLIDLSVESGKPVVLIGALNGSGKTTILEAIQLALFGRAVRSTSRGRMGYQDYLEQLINRDVRPEVGAAVSLTFRHRRGGTDERYTILRTWRKTGTNIKERIEVLRNETPDTEATDRWLEFVEEFLPVQLADLFLFDGERIEALADPERSTDFLRAGIHALLGLDLVDHLIRTLAVHERNKRTGGVTNRGLRERLEKAEVHLFTLLKRREQIINDKATAQTTLDQATRSLDKARQRLLKEGGHLYKERDRITADAEQADRELAHQLEKMREIASGEAPLLLVPSLLHEARVLAERSEDDRVASKVYAVLAERDSILRTLLQQCKVSKPAQQKIDRYLKESLAEWSRGPENSLQVEIRSRGFEDISEESWRQLRDRIRTELHNFEQVQSKRHAAHVRRAAVPTEDSLKSVMEMVHAAEESVSLAAAKVELLEDELARVNREIQRAERELERAQESVRQVDLQSEVDARVIRHSQRARETLKKFREAVASRNVERLSTLITQRFKALVRKGDRLIDGLRIDPRSFRLELYDSRGLHLDPLLLSAGERQLLAVAIVWALATASGRILPTVIDTPLGRLDGQHRSKLVETYFPSASHQVVLLSTDEEISGTYYERLRPSVSREYLLTFDPVTRSTHVKPGYFVQAERAVA